MSAAVFFCCAAAGVLITVFTSRHSPVFGAFAGAALCIVLIIAAFDRFKQLISECTSLFGDITSQTQSAEILIRVFALTAAGSLCADICRDNGESAVAGTVEFVSTVLALSAALPLLESVIKLAVAMIG